MTQKSGTKKLCIFLTGCTFAPYAPCTSHHWGVTCRGVFEGWPGQLSAWGYDVDDRQERKQQHAQEDARDLFTRSHCLEALPVLQPVRHHHLHPVNSSINQSINQLILTLFTASASDVATYSPGALPPMTLKLNKVLEVVEVHVRAKFHQAKCSGSCVINSALDFGHL